MVNCMEQADDRHPFLLDKEFRLKCAFKCDVLQTKFHGTGTTMQISQAITEK